VVVLWQRNPTTESQCFYEGVLQHSQKPRVCLWRISKNSERCSADGYDELDADDDEKQMLVAQEMPIIIGGH